jgi:hypothetical protein
MANKLVRGSLIILIGNIIFRIGGYVYRFLMAILLGPTAYGILGITLPFQGIFQTLSAGGLPPAIAKYVAEYEAVDEKDMAPYRRLAALHGYRVHVVTVENRHGGRNRHGVTAAQLAAMRQNYEVKL